MAKKAASKKATLNKTDILNAALEAEQSRRDKTVARIERLKKEARAEEQAIVVAQFKSTAKGKRMLKAYGPELEAGRRGWYSSKEYFLTVVGKNPKVELFIKLTGARLEQVKKVYAKYEKIETLKKTFGCRRWGQPERETPVDKRQLVRHVMREAPDLMVKMEAIVEIALARHMKKVAKAKPPKKARKR